MHIGMLILGLALGSVAILLLVFGFRWIVSLPGRDIHLTNVAAETGKIIVAGTHPVKFLFNSNSGYYKKNNGERDGQWQPGDRQKLGWIFNHFGRVFYGIYPIYKVLKFDVSWSVYAEGEIKDGKETPPHVVPKTVCGCTSFSRYYTHAVEILGAEMGHEGDKEDDEDPKKKDPKKDKDPKDTSVTRIDAIVLVTIEITNIRDAVYKIPPQGIVFEQADIAIGAAFNDYVKEMTWAAFKKKPKGDQDSNFVKVIIAHTNSVLNDLKIGMRIKAVELRDFDLTPSPENKALAESQTLVLIAQNKGDAEIALAEREKTAAKLRGQGTRAELSAVAKVVGPAGAVQLEALTRVAKTQLRVYGEPTRTTSVVSLGDGENKGEPTKTTPETDGEKSKKEKV